MKARLIAAFLMGMLCLTGSTYALEKEPAAAQEESQDAKDLQDIMDFLDMVKGGLTQLLDVVEAMKEAPGLTREGMSVFWSLNTEMTNLTLAEAECAKGDTEACQKRLRQRCPELAASYGRFKERIDAFNKHVAETKLSDDAKKFFLTISSYVDEVIAGMKEKLMGLSCISA